MLWLLLGSLALLIAGGIIIKVLPKLVLLGAILALMGAVGAGGMWITTLKEDAKNAAKCASIDGSYGGDTCFVSGIEKDLKAIGL